MEQQIICIFILFHVHFSFAVKRTISNSDGKGPSNVKHCFSMERYVTEVL